MKKVILSLILAASMISLFAVSYDDNEFQRKSRAYTELANRAYDDGDYDAAIEYAKLASEYARQSAEFIQKMLARTEAEQEMNRARTRFTWAKQNDAEKRYPEAYSTAEEALSSGSLAFDNENYDVAVVYAQKVMEVLSVVQGNEKDDSSLAELPAEYRVRTWRGERDCLWNIAANKAIYGNPFMWRKLYEANKGKLPNNANPDLLEPGLILKIPSLNGEKRSGLYDPSKTYKSIPKK